MFVTASRTQTFYGKRNEFNDKEAEALEWLFSLMEKTQNYLVPVLTTHTQPGPFPTELLEAHAAVKGKTSVKKKAESSSKEA